MEPNGVQSSPSNVHRDPLESIGLDSIGLHYSPLYSIGLHSFPVCSIVVQRGPPGSFVSLRDPSCAIGLQRPPL
eukprot:9730727-Lingulodinium_polyedra.AAC.1